jgi:uncharacterized damage-inducible protein DinB
MTISQSLVPEFDHEMANTRKTLERVPDDKFGWKPHEKSMSMGNLATHLANIPGWGYHTLATETLDLNPPGGEPMPSPKANTREEVLAMFDQNIAQARAAIAAASDEQLLHPWSLLVGGQTIFTLPRVAALRAFVLSHNVHHRAQLGVYLRLNDIPVPSIYGPSADEGGF